MCGGVHYGEVEGVISVAREVVFAAEVVHV